LLAGFGIVTSQNITTGLVAHYEFENTAGDVIDVAGGHNGTNYGATRGATGKVGNAFSFDGGDYVVINNHTDITGYNEFTLSAWIYPTSVTGTKTIISKNTSGRDFTLNINSTPKVGAHFHGATGYRTCASTTTPSTNQWIHAVATWSNNQWKIYYNGVLESTCTHTGYDPPWTGGNMYIGSLTTSSEKFSGLIDEVRVYNRALSATDVTALYNYTGGGTIPALSVSNAEINESDGTATFLVNASQPSTSNITFNYTTANGTAIAGSDYTAKSGTATITAGNTSLLASVAIIDDSSIEPDETFTFTISNPVNATISNATGTCTIHDNDVAGLTCTNTIASYPYSESFESSSNTWVNGTGDDTNWTWKSGSTPSSSTGPTAAQDGSYYYYVEASSPNNPSKTAVLESSCFDLTGESSAEFSFYSHMYGSAMGTLSLEATTDGTNWNSLWSKSGNQGNEWFQATVNLSTYLGGKVKLRFYGTTGSNYYSDMAIDNVTLTTESGGVTSVNSYVGNVQLNLGLSNNNLSISGGNTISLPYGIGDITGVTAGTGLTGGGTSGSVTINADNTSALWNASEIQGIPVSTATPQLNQVLKYVGGQWTPSADETGTGTSLWTSDGSGNIYFTSAVNGKVGIGTSQPDQALTVAGNIHAEEVVVETNIPAPDYVFDENYPLRTVRELEAFLKTYSHLPDIPSAKEMETNGINLSELNLMLLKRIEELTLYLIDQEKRIQKMEEKNSQNTTK
ncbi:MAG: LamG-like jellyroll fold domain-containing protein, partial [Draconibacterium sp.]